MNITCGTDIIEIERIKKSIEDTNGKFINEIYTKNEIEYCENRKRQKYQHYAARFAAKEAVFKAISIILENKYDISWKDIEIIDDQNGRPHINFINKIFDKLISIDISLSHCKESAIAYVVMMYK